MEETMDGSEMSCSNDSVSRTDLSASISDSSLTGDLSSSNDFFSFRRDNSNSTLNMEDNSDEDELENGIYYFESDHMALKGNRDYQLMLRAIAMLEAERVQAVKDLDRLYKARAEALADPIKFVDKLQHGLDPDLPKPQKIASLPVINWEKYTSNLDFSSLGVHKHMTRLKKQLVEGTSEDGSVAGGVAGGPEEGQGDDSSVVRGRVRTDNKPTTFNQLWTAEEQKRLEELLLKHPPEEVEAKRFQKIATALGNRTPIQVASRVQKYFIKLAKAGLPIPGRRPNVNINTKKTSHRHHRYHKFYYQQSTFLQSHEPPVYMSDDDDDSQGFGGSCFGSQFDMTEDAGEVSDEEDVPVELRDSDEYQELLHLKRLRNQKLKSQDGSAVEHVGFKCDRCECEPIVGTRWHCTDCPQDVAVDFCDDCVDSSFETEHHNCSHRLRPVRRAGDGSFVDKDYTEGSFMPGGYNYLDSNYMPAS